MMTTKRPLPEPVMQQQVNYSEAVVALSLGGGRLLLDDGCAARTALSCLLAPQSGDRVLYLAASGGERWVLHVLSRMDAGEACIEVAGIPRLTIASPELTLCGERRLALITADEADLTAAGRLTLSARDLTFNVLGSLLQSARHVVGRCETWLMTASGLGRLHARQTLVTADEDIRADAERISLG
ncbi:hypothetical protein GCM10007907_16520 [Chitinimonas prasina]|uniref:DUF3540 domain-containing protein n=1 Tax=Chitinimonas prasina TaxID=1434937 RepID=A0ABQ5YEG9_9NEIS|nr:DUF3540 domain-containing protein [Chitinimonas prasina]GLR12862.1 hypothetical protein GCM10007907_16520 [Chitinimonas prasina]